MADNEPEHESAEYAPRRARALVITAVVLVIVFVAIGLLS